MYSSLKIISLLSALLGVSAWSQNGDGTYYGGIGGKWGPGTCHQTYKPDGYWGIALNSAQYGGGWVCGSCIKGCIYYRSGNKKCFKGIINNKCGTCGWGDLDFGLEGEGKYRIGWDYIDCPDRYPIMSTGKNDSRYWAAIKIEGNGPQNYVVVNGKPAKRENGMWSVRDSEGRLGCGAKVEVGFASGKKITTCMSGKMFGGGYCPKGGKKCYKRFLESEEEEGNVIEEVVLETLEENEINRKLHTYIDPDPSEDVEYVDAEEMEYDAEEMEAEDDASELHIEVPAI
mmetsp:Transcript_9078/g.13573  ORF Transcript_9078/g.13573 Transcript_9078/m.13573 type:complete len:286 (-) Transcript_9078:36-893(-)|eukprot:CAMPEP_0171461540 /NCGR_PEP_ID=MMETSP0945-20130129/5945_1 /TAXON_ID=109269 /ORGANISM="Vaucheria litorea, Strain CCMP2940" /LENGTH=285 /DNA_ID=CAMNT_0011987903 /DNA_START=123 /DNA_END=980 /DNA_ORIENTATION=-